MNQELMDKIRIKREAKEAKIESLEKKGFKMRDGRYLHPDGREVKPPWNKS